MPELKAHGIRIHSVARRAMRSVTHAKPPCAYFARCVSHPRGDRIQRPRPRSEWSVRSPGKQRTGSPAQALHVRMKNVRELRMQGNGSDRAPRFRSADVDACSAEVHVSNVEMPRLVFSKASQREGGDEFIGTKQTLAAACAAARKS